MAREYDSETDPQREEFCYQEDQAMGEACGLCGKGLDDNNHRRDIVGGIHQLRCWPCAMKLREDNLEDPKTFLKGLGFGLAMGLGAWLAFA